MRWLIIALCLVAFPAVAQSFEQIWEERIALPLMPVEPAKPFDEQQFNEEIVKRARVKKNKSRDDSCLTLKEARKEYGGVYLSWRGDHCWYAPSHKKRRSS